MKGLLLALAIVPLQAGGAVPSSAPVQYDGETAFVSVSCPKEEGECSGQVSLAAVGAPTSVIGAPTGFTIAAESGDKVRVPIAGDALAGIDQVLVIVDGVPQVRAVERVRTETGIGEGQTEVSPAARERPCRSVTGATQVRVRGLECVEALRIVRAGATKKAKRFTVSGYACRRITKTNVTCTSDERRVRWRRSGK